MAAPVLVLAVVMVSASLSTGAAAQLQPDFPIYSAAAAEGPNVADSSWNGARLADVTNQVVGGGRVVAFSPKAWSGLQWYIKWPMNQVDGTKYAGLSFKLAAAAAYTPEMNVGVQVQPPGGQLQLKGVPLKRYLAGGLARQAWQAVYVPLADLQAGASLANIISIYWQESSGKQQGTLYLTDILLVTLPPACGVGGSLLRPPPPSPPPARPPPPPPPSPPPARPPPPRPPASPPSARSLYTRGNGIFWPNGTRFSGRGVNVFDTRSCGACTGSQNVTEAKRRIDFAVANMGASLLRLVLEARVPNDPTDPNNGAQYCVPDCTVSDAYLADVQELARYAGTRYPTVQVLVSIWQTTYAWGETSLGWPTAATNAYLTRIVRAVGQYPWVWFGMSNEPESNFDGAQDAQVWQAMNSAVAAVRQQELALGFAPHIITVQGTRAWARSLAYYTTRPITAGSGAHVAYETHIYNPTADFDTLLVSPANTLPVVVGEFGPVDNYMNTADTEALMQRANALGVPWLAWSLHMRCPPNLLVDNSAGGCGENMPLQLTAWGKLVKKYL